MQVLEHRVGDKSVKIGGKTNVLSEPVAGVSLRPNDPLAKKLASKGVGTQNVLVKVTVPKWTGRKRKRGSDEPFAPAPLSELSNKSIKAPDLLRRLRSNEESYSIKPVGIIEETHKFRSQPDFQMHTSDVPIMAALRDHAMKPSYDALKKLKVDLRPGSRDATAFPLPPSLVPMDQPFRYEYQQVADVPSGRLMPKNQPLAADAREVPQGPPIGYKIQKLSEPYRKVVEQLRELLDKRPLITRRVAVATFPEITIDTFANSCAWVGYSFSAGPWRDVLIKYGVDPRSDPRYRFYQTLMLKLDRQTMASSIIPAVTIQTEDNKENAGELRQRHIFDGITVTREHGKLWQVCDITDPVLYDILHTSTIRSECEVFQWGWHHNGTLSKARIIMRDKVRCLLAGQVPAEEDYKELASTIPDDVTGENVKLKQLSFRSKHAVQLARDVGNFAPGYAHLRKAKGLDTPRREMSMAESDVLEGDSVREEVDGEDHSMNLDEGADLDDMGED